MKDNGNPKLLTERKSTKTGPAGRHKFNKVDFRALRIKGWSRIVEEAPGLLRERKK